MRKCVCPNCNAQLSFNDDREFAFCEYCGTKVMLDDYRETFRFVDEARVKEAEARMRELELEREKMEEARETLPFAYLVALAFIILGVIMRIFNNSSLGALLILIGIVVGVKNYQNAHPEEVKKAEEERKAKAAAKKAQLEAACKDAQSRYGRMIDVPIRLINSSQNYRTVEAELRGLGFENIRLVNMRDLTIGFLETKGKVQSVTINGAKKGIQSLDDNCYMFPASASVVITYHGYKFGRD